MKVKECCTYMEGGFSYLGVIQSYGINNVTVDIYPPYNSDIKLYTRHVDVSKIDCSNQLFLQLTANRRGINTGLRYYAQQPTGEWWGWGHGVMNLPKVALGQWECYESHLVMGETAVVRDQWKGSLCLLWTNQEREEFAEKLEASFDQHEAWAERYNEYALSGTDDRPSLPVSKMMEVEHIQNKVGERNVYVPEPVEDEFLPF